MHLLLGLLLLGKLLTNSSLPDGDHLERVPRVASFQPGPAPVEPGTFVVVAFTASMDAASVSVQVQPATEYWSYWRDSRHIVLQAVGSWLPLTRYQVSVGGRASNGTELGGQKEFRFETTDTFSFASSGCRSRTIVYHILGRPKNYERPENFVDWGVFRNQISRLIYRGFRFGAPDEVCWPGNEDMVSIQFDDGWASQYEAAKYLSARGVRAFFALTVSNLDHPELGYLTRAQAAEMGRIPGIIIGSHLEQHDCISETAWRMEPAARASYLSWQLQQSQLDLMRITGQPIKFLVYPHGCFDGLIAQEASRYYQAAWTGLESITLPEHLSTWYGRQRFTVLDSTVF